MPVEVHAFTTVALCVCTHSSAVEHLIHGTRCLRFHSVLVELCTADYVPDMHT